MKSFDSRGTRRTPTGLKKKIRLKSGSVRLSPLILYDPICPAPFFWANSGTGVHHPCRSVPKCSSDPTRKSRRYARESPRQTKPKRVPKRKVHEFRPFLWILLFFLGKTSTIHIELLFRNLRAAKQGGFKRGVFLIWTCPSFFVLFRPFWDFPDFFWDFPDLLGGSPRIFPICPFPLSRPILKSAYEEQSRKGPRHNLDLSRKKWETPGFGTPPV